MVCSASIVIDTVLIKCLFIGSWKMEQCAYFGLYALKYTLNVNIAALRRRPFQCQTGNSQCWWFTKIADVSKCVFAGRWCAWLHAWMKSRNKRAYWTGLNKIQSVFQKGCGPRKAVGLLIIIVQLDTYCPEIRHKVHYECQITVGNCHCSGQRYQLWYFNRRLSEHATRAYFHQNFKTTVSWCPAAVDYKVEHICSLRFKK